MLAAARLYFIQHSCFYIRTLGSIWQRDWIESFIASLLLEENKNETNVVF
jgi:hypothetical protein